MKWRGLATSFKDERILGICCKQVQAPATQDLTFGSKRRPGAISHPVPIVQTAA
jgi:hypothetical protein